MRNFYKLLLLVSSCVLLLTACRKKALDEYYGRPASLEPPIYQVLQSKGHFSTLLSVIDKSGYQKTLSAAGYWSFFAPNDDAFTAYFKEKNITGVDQLDSAACQKIVTYSLVYNAFNKDRIDDFQSNTGWVPNTSFRRRTASYKGVYSTTDLNGQPIFAIASNRNNNAAGLNYIDADQNNKYLPIYTDVFFSSSVLTSADYNYFYPNTTFTGFNVANASVLEKDIAAENGVIHEVDHVISTLPSIDDYLASKPEYSEFKKLFDKYLVQYVLNQTATNNYNNRGGSGQVYTKVFNSALAYSPNNENYLKTQDNDGQANSYTMFAPTNTVLLSYIKNTLLENYPAGSTLDAVPRQIVYDFVNAHMWQGVVWPSKFKKTYNYLNEEARFDPNSDIVDKQMLSNGAFYGTSKVQEANVFTTVYARAYLDPAYSQMVQLMASEIRTVVTNPLSKYTIFMMSNSAIAAAGYTQNPKLSADPNNQWVFTPPLGSFGVGVSGSTAYQRLLRILRMGIVSTPNDELADLSGTGVFETYGSEFVGYSNNRIQAAGNVDDSIGARTWVNITGTKTSVNGRVYYCDKLLDYSELPIGRHIEKISSAPSSPNYYFWQYLKNATYDNFYVPATWAINGVASGSFYTVFIPDTTAIIAAINATPAQLPYTLSGTVRRPNFTPTTQADQLLVKNFISYHILNKRTIGTDGVTQGIAVETLLVDPATGAATTITINSNSKTALTLRDMLATSSFQATTVPGNINYLSNRCLIHTINNYLRSGL